MTYLYALLAVVYFSFEWVRAKCENFTERKEVSSQKNPGGVQARYGGISGNLEEPLWFREKEVPLWFILIWADGLRWVLKIAGASVSLGGKECKNLDRVPVRGMNFSWDGARSRN